MKVNLASNQLKKSYFPISLDSSTTANFGECLPIFMHELPPNSSCRLNVRDAVRFAPLSFPTFGKAYLKTYTYAHKLSDLYPPFENLLSKTPYVGGSGTEYIPQSVPSLPAWFYFLMVACNCKFSLYGIKNYSSTNSDDGAFNATNFSYVPINYVQYNNGTNWTSVKVSLTDTSLSLPLWLIDSLMYGSIRLNIGSMPNGALLSRLSINLKQSGVSDHVFFNRAISNLGSFFVSGNTSSGVTPDDPDFVSIDSADFLVPLCETSNLSGFSTIDSDGNYKFNSGSIRFVTSDDSLQYPEDVFVAIRLTNSGKFLRKILMGLGYQIYIGNRNLSILPLYAFFKSYFHTFAPKRFVKFEQTSFYKLINSNVNSNLGMQYLAVPNNADNANISLYNSSIKFSEIIDDLVSCFYTKDTDYFSAQINDLINKYGGDLSATYLAQSTVTNGSSHISSNIEYGNNAGLNFDNTSVNGSYPLLHTQSQQNILSRLTQFINRRSVSGSRIAKLLQSVFGIAPGLISENDESFFIGSNSLDVNFGDVFSTAETAEGSLGEFAGRAFASGDGDIFNIDTKIHTIVLSFCTIVPRTQYVQGVSPFLSHITSDTFYNPLYDGLTLLPTLKSNLYTGSQFEYIKDSISSFGNLPIYSEYKTKVNGVLSGDLSLRSTKNTYDSFTMDEIISSYEHHTPKDGSGGVNDIGRWSSIRYNFSNLVNGTMWRYLGRWIWLGRFDRIFVNNRLNYNDFLGSIIKYDNIYEITSSRDINRSDDNLIVHNVVDMNINSAMVPLSGSFMTDDLLSLDKEGILSNIQ